MNFLNLIIGIITGVISGLGIGGGSLLVLYLTAIANTTQHVAGGMNLLYFIACAPAALIGHIRQKSIEWQSVVWCALSGVPIAGLISYFTSDINQQWLKRLFGLLLLYIGIREWKAAKTNNV